MNSHKHIIYKPLWWYHELRARIDCGRLWNRATICSNKPKNYAIPTCCFSAMHTVLRGKSKNWLARNQDNVSEWGDMSIFWYLQALWWGNCISRIVLICSEFIDYPFFNKNTEWIFVMSNEQFFRYIMTRTGYI